MKSNKEVIKRLLDNLIPYGAKKVILFGSQARGDHDLFSDIDIVIIKDTNKRFLQRLKEVSLLIDNSLIVDVFVYTPKEFENLIEEKNPFIERVIQEGKVIYEKR